MKVGQQLIRHIGNIITAEKGKRIVYALANIIFIAIAVLAGFGVIKSFDIMTGQTFIGGLLLIIVCIAFAIIFLINGIIGQLIMLVWSIVLIFNPDERKYAIVSVIIALLSFGAMAAALIFILK